MYNFEASTPEIDPVLKCVKYFRINGYIVCSSVMKMGPEII